MSTNLTHELGDGYTAERVPTGTAYARNGNLSNPTVQYRYDVRDDEGRLIGTTRTLRSARALHAEAVR